MSLKFKKKKEDFICENCGAIVKGNGFTNHCPKCLYSKHVDIFPGDRSQNCGGLMKPISAEESGEKWSLVHKCLKCGKEQKNKISKEDDFGEVVKISAKS
jgi:DNA-directed RNA polymerase subunit RPC12/RpoP